MLWDLIRQAAGEYARKIAFESASGSVSFEELAGRAAGIAKLLGSAGVEPGDRVAVLRRNTPGLACALGGVLARGAVVVSLNPALRPDEVASCLAPCSPKSAFIEESASPGIREALARAGVPEANLFLPTDLEGLRGGEGSIGMTGDSAAFDLFSTGSTGFPKRVVRTHAMLASDAEAYQAAARLTPEDRICGVAPMFHSYGLSCAFLSVLRSGASAFLFEGFDGESILRAITEKRLTVYPGSAFHFSLLAGLTPRPGTDLTSLRLCFSCGLALPAEVESRFRARYFVPVHQMYGATECSSATMNLEGEHESLVESAGLPLPGVAIAIFREDGSPAGALESGEIGVLGPAVASRYEDLPELSRRIFRSGWFLSGDLGSLDVAGNLSITGRIKLMINVAGNKVDPLEVETILTQHPSIAEAAVVGVMGPHATEQVKAFVVTRAGVSAAELRGFCSERLASYKVPRIIEFIDRLPRSPTGKLLRKDLLR